MKKYLLTIIFILLVDSLAWATAQKPDRIIYQGVSYDLFTNPLEPYFRNHPDKKPETAIMSSALWRGYVATFSITAHQLVIHDIEIQVEKETSGHKMAWKSVLPDVFPEKTHRQTRWFSGLLVIPQGELVQYVHMGYASEYEKYTVLQISNGQVNKAKDFSHHEYITFKRRQFEAFQQTENYQHLVDKLRHGNDDADWIRDFIAIHVIDYTTTFLVDF